MGNAAERVYTTVDKSEWGAGPWNDEPDKVQFTDKETGLPLNCQNDDTPHRFPSSDGPLDFLKAVKDGLLCYAVVLEYGQQAMGLDDTGASDEERQIRVVARPAGFLGGLVFVWQGNARRGSRARPIRPADRRAEPSVGGSSSRPVRPPPGRVLLGRGR
jgi:hypothetical protein